MFLYLALCDCGRFFHVTFVKCKYSRNGAEEFSYAECMGSPVLSVVEKKVP